MYYISCSIVKSLVTSVYIIYTLQAYWNLKPVSRSLESHPINVLFTSFSCLMVDFSETSLFTAKPCISLLKKNTARSLSCKDLPITVTLNCFVLNVNVTLHSVIWTINCKSVCLCAPCASMTGPPPLYPEPALFVGHYHHLGSYQMSRV